MDDIVEKASYRRRGKGRTRGSGDALCELKLLSYLTLPLENLLTKSSCALYPVNGSASGDPASSVRLSIQSTDFTLACGVGSVRKSSGLIYNELNISMEQLHDRNEFNHLVIECIYGSEISSANSECMTVKKHPKPYFAVDNRRISGKVLDMKECIGSGGSRGKHIWKCKGPLNHRARGR